MSHTAICEVEEHLHEHEHPAPSPDGPSGPAATAAALPRAGRWKSVLDVSDTRWALAALALFAVGASARAAGAPGWVQAVAFAGCYAAGGWQPGLAGLRALRSRVLDVDLLMVAAALGAAAVGQPLDGGLLIVIFATSGALEAVATRHTRDSVTSLLTLAPEHASLVDGEGHETVVDAADLLVDQVIVVRPGERIAADGAVVAGTSEVDQASITGEPLPVAKEVGDAVFAGTVNGTGALRVRVERAADDTVVARIVALVAEASATKARLQLFIERVEQRYSLAMVSATVALFALPLAAGDALRPALLRAMTFMIVASPCAVVLATMPPLLSAIATAGRRGVLVKSAVVMELLGRTDLVAFDKTGTLTEGRPHLAEVFVPPSSPRAEGGILALAAAAETSSEHPIGRALVAAALERRLPIPAAVTFSSAPGRGVEAVIDGHLVAVGSPRLLDELPTRPDDPADPGPRAPRDTSAERLAVARLQDQGQTAVVVTIDGTPAAVLGLADRARPAAAETITALWSLTGRIPVLLTGDNSGAARRLARDVGIEDARAGLLPEDKVAAVRGLQADGTRVAVVGDGVNDAPALAVADLGMAMGEHGADLTLDTADVVVVRDELGTVPAVIALSRRARAIVVQNLCVAAVVIAVLSIADLTGHLPLPLGVAGHEGSTVVVGLNGLRLLSRRAWHAPS